MTDRGISIEDLNQVIEAFKKLPQMPLSINFSSGLDAHCAIEAWQAEVKPSEPFDFQGIPIKISHALPENVMMFMYSNKMAFFNVDTGKSWEIRTGNAAFISIYDITEREL